jgi:transposase
MGRTVEGKHFPEGQAEQQAAAEMIGKDGATLLSAVFASGAPDWLRHIPTIETLRRVWVQNYFSRRGRSPLAHQ